MKDKILDIVFNVVLMSYSWLMLLFRVLFAHHDNLIYPLIAYSLVILGCCLSLTGYVKEVVKKVNEKPESLPDLKNVYGMDPVEFGSWVILGGDIDTFTDESLTRTLS
jgi:hypothetical protein